MAGPAETALIAPAGALAGRTIAVTRPLAQAEPLAAAIEAAGGRALRVPLLCILPVADAAPLRAVARRLDDFSLACFVSPNAVEHALAAILAERTWPPGLLAATVGTSSEAALAAHGITRAVAPRTRFDSEALLELPELAADAVRGSNVAIFRGDGGRELLGDTLTARGAKVEYVTCYHRSRPAQGAHLLLGALDAGALDAITLTSSEAVGNLVDLLGERAAQVLDRVPLFVPHARIAERARAAGAREVVLTTPADAGLLAGLASHFANR